MSPRAWKMVEMWLGLLIGVAIGALILVGAVMAFSHPASSTEATSSPWSIDKAPTGDCFLIYRMGSAGAGNIYTPVQKVPC